LEFLDGWGLLFGLPEVRAGLHGQPAFVGRIRGAGDPHGHSGLIEARPLISSEGD
jgi:hypothetical protein